MATYKGCDAHGLTAAHTHTSPPPSSTAWQGAGLLGVDTLHLFPETHVVAAAVEARYGKKISWFKPAGCTTRAEFEAAHGGPALSMNHADFDLHSKVEPYSTGLKALGRELLITGRRSDQGDKRVSLDTFEPGAKIFNPMAAWAWGDVTAFVDAHDVPVNPAHSYVFRASESVDPRLRHLPDAAWARSNLGKPFWRATDAELKGTPPAKHAYVFKSFGDTHTTVPGACREGVQGCEGGGGLGVGGNSNGALLTAHHLDPPIPTPPPFPQCTPPSRSGRGASCCTQTQSAASTRARRCWAHRTAASW